jgi:aminoglycoside phosphotransferase
MSHAAVFRVEHESGARAYLKTAEAGSDADLRGEVARLLWMEDRVPVPRVRYFAEVGANQLLLTDVVPGVPIFEDSLRDRLPQVIAEYGRALQQIHALPIDACPFDERLDVKLATARRAIESGQVRTDLFDEEYAGRMPGSLYEELLSGRPKDEDLVFTHGDYCAPNVLVEPVTLEMTGFVDVGRAGVSDRYQDLALAARSTAFNFGPEWVQPFLHAYGIAQPDEAKMAFYRLLDEFY